MPCLGDANNQRGYRTIIQNTFKQLLLSADLTIGGLAVVYNKNLMEASGYTAVIADIMKEKVWLVLYYNGDQDPPCKWEEEVFHVKDKKQG